jgi:hypothetical protein
MAGSKTPWLTYALLAGGTYVAYRLYQNYATTAAPAVATGTPIIPVLPTPTGQTINNQVMAPVPSQQIPVATIQPSLPNGITSSVYSVVQSWAQTDGRAPVLVMAAANVPSEYAGMYDLITNYWDKNISPGPAQVTFWNNLRGKYDPGDAIW